MVCRASGKYQGTPLGAGIYRKAICQLRHSMHLEEIISNMDVEFTKKNGAVKKQRQDRRGHSEKGGLFKLREREGKRAQKSKPGVKPAEKDGE